MSEATFTPDGVVVYLSLVPYLRSRGDEPVLLAELAERFGMPPERMRRLIESIAANGTNAIDFSSFFELDWEALEERDEVRLTNFVAFEHPPVLGGHERASLIAGLRMLAGVEDAEARAAIARLIAKLGGTTPIDAAPDLALDEDAARIARAIDDGRRLAFAYRSPASGDTRRRVDPLRLEGLDDEPYLVAWCLDRDDRRVFRLDRMREVELLDEPAAPHPGAAEGGIYRAGEDDLDAVLEAASAALPQAIEFLAPDEPIPNAAKPGPHRLAVKVARLDRLARLAAEHADRIEVLEPAEAREAAAQWAREGLAGYDAAPASE